jgi:hypothetical protein
MYEAAQVELDRIRRQPDMSVELERYRSGYREF